MDNKNLVQIKKLYARLDELLKQTGTTCEYLNFGYWKDTNVLDKACEAMIDLVIDTLCIEKRKTLLDVGYGYGTQDIYIASKYPHIEIYGINVIENQYNIAIQKVINQKMSDRIYLSKGDATSMPYKESVFDAAIAIESAFHFSYRHTFFAECYRVLKIGGVLCLADCLPDESFIQDSDFIETSIKMGIPIENQYTIQEYVLQLNKSGFNNVKYQNITEYVLPYSAIEMNQINGWRGESIIDLPDKESISNQLKKFTELTTFGTYYIITAHK
ncbi:MAG: SAM-dependent methyltransferase [Bacteroidota bacterium]|jgi:cyclopropane fatty-acyl-phospholipid synthase-like methyltransferase